MSEEKETTRVLSRTGARVLNAAELEAIAGAFAISRCTFDPTTCAMDGVCTPLPRCPH